MSIEEIRQAKDELIKMSNDDIQRELYEMRAKTLKDKISALNEAERKGIQKGIQEGEKKKAIEIAKSLLDVLHTYYFPLPKSKKSFPSLHFFNTSIW